MNFVYSCSFQEVGKPGISASTEIVAESEKEAENICRRLYQIHGSVYISLKGFAKPCSRDSFWVLGEVKTTINRQPGQIKCVINCNRLTGADDNTLCNVCGTRIGDLDPAAMEHRQDWPKYRIIRFVGSTKIPYVSHPI